MTQTYAKIGLAYSDCDAAKAANDPESIRKLASAPLAEQLKKYQDLVYAPAEPETASGEANPMLDSTTAPPAIADEDHYFIARQRVAFVKQTVILAPATVYVPAAPRTVAVTRELSHQSSNVRVYEQANPAVKTTRRSWSEVERNTTAELPRSIPHPVRNAATAARAKTGRENGEAAKTERAAARKVKRVHRRRR
jgi:hypothetical protein